MSAIRPNDLVVVVRTCCRVTRFAEGLWLTVRAISTPEGFRCRHCGITTMGNIAHLPGAGTRASTSETEYGWYPLSWLKRIPPLEELENKKTEEAVRA